MIRIVVSDCFFLQVLLRIRRLFLILFLLFWLISMDSHCPLITLLKKTINIIRSNAKGIRREFLNNVFEKSFQLSETLMIHFGDHCLYSFHLAYTEDALRRSLGYEQVFMFYSIDKSLNHLFRPWIIPFEVSSLQDQDGLKTID